MFKLNKWYLTRSLPAFRDSESFTILEQTYKLWQAMEQFETEYNSFVDSFNAEWELFETKYNGDIETFTLAMRQEFADFIEVVDLKLAGLETSIPQLQSEINTIKNIIASDDVNLDTLQELVNALKNNVGSINDIFTELSKKANKEETIRVIKQDITYNTIADLYNSYGETFIAYIGYYGYYAFVSIKTAGSSIYNISVISSICMVNGTSVEGTTAILSFVNNPTTANTYSNSMIDSKLSDKANKEETIKNINDNNGYAPESVMNILMQKYYAGEIKSNEWCYVNNQYLSKVQFVGSGVLAYVYTLGEDMTLYYTSSPFSQSIPLESAGTKTKKFQPELTAGEGITIENNVISASGSGGATMIEYGSVSENKITFTNYLENATLYSMYIMNSGRLYPLTFFTNANISFYMQFYFIDKTYNLTINKTSITFDSDVPSGTSYTLYKN